MTKAELITDLSSKAGFVSINKDVVDNSFWDSNQIEIKRKSHFEVEYTDTLGNTQTTNVYYIEDTTNNTAKYQGSSPVFQPDQTDQIKSNALYAYFNSKNAWKAYNVEYINPQKSFAVLTTIQKDTANKFYTQRVIVFENSGLKDNNIEPNTYIPV